MVQTSGEATWAATLRPARIEDAEAISAIYNHYVAASTATFDELPELVDSRKSWLEVHQQLGLPVLVCERDGQVVAWGSLSSYSDRCAYRTTVEISVYVHHEQHRTGLGKRLVRELLAAGRREEYHCVLARICSENDASIKLFGSEGFEIVGEMREVGRKFGRWLNVTIMELIL